MELELDEELLVLLDDELLLDEELLDEELVLDAALEGEALAFSQRAGSLLELLSVGMPATNEDSFTVPTARVLPSAESARL